MADNHVKEFTTGTDSWNAVVQAYGNAKGTKDQFKDSDPTALNDVIGKLQDTSGFAMRTIHAQLGTIITNLNAAWKGENADQAVTTLTGLQTDAKSVSDSTGDVATALKMFQKSWNDCKTAAANLDDDDDAGARKIFDDYLKGENDSLHYMPNTLYYHLPLSGKHDDDFTPTPGPPGGPGNLPGNLPGPGNAPGHLPAVPGNHPGNIPGHTGTPGNYPGTPGNYPGTPGNYPGGYDGGSGIGPGAGVNTGSSLAGLDSGGGMGGGAGSGGLGTGGGVGSGGVGSSGGLGSSAAGLGADGAGLGTGAGAGAASGAAGGRGMMAPMHGGGSGDEEERERSTWLTEDDDVWGGDDAPPGVIA